MDLKADISLAQGSGSANDLARTIAAALSSTID
jgi:hypothetical protein